MTGAVTGKPIWWEIGPDDIVAVDLPDEQRELMIKALSLWGGPTRPTDTIARAMGFANADAIEGDGERLRTALGERRGVSMRDWARALVATEIVYGSSYYGAGTDWDCVTGWSDEHTLPVLRSLQRSLGGLRAPPRHIGGLQDPFAEPDD